MWRFFAALVLLTESPDAALAQNPLAPAGNFNAFLASNETLVTNESEGAIALDGNLTVAGNYQVAIKGNVTTFTVNGYPVGLVVGGGVILQSGRLQVNSNRYVKTDEWQWPAYCQYELAEPGKAWFV